MAHDEGGRCFCSADHQPYPLELTSHHIWPLGEGGPNQPENRVWLCPTAHYNVHEILRLIHRHDGALTWAQLGELYDVPVSRYAYAVAVEGYQRGVGGVWVQLPEPSWAHY